MVGCRCWHGVRDKAHLQRPTVRDSCKMERVDPRLIDGDGRQVAIRGGGAVGHDLWKA